MHCRVCNALDPSFLGRVEYYKDYPHDIYDCFACGCRFTTHTDEIYERLHAHEHSRYGGYRQAAHEAKEYYDNHDINGLRGDLCKISKYEFVIRSIDGCPTTSKILEVGCAEGFLTSYFILLGYDIIGVDVSSSALESARRNFGPRFFRNDAELIADRSPYDFIYHTGTIGCVADPVGLTHLLLRLLKPGGKLLFNAPNVDACWLRGQLWVDSAPPPDLVTLFRPGFWTRSFSKEATVSEEVENCPGDLSIRIGLKKKLRSWTSPTPQSLDGNCLLPQNQSEPTEYQRMNNVAALARKCVLETMVKLCPKFFIRKQPAEFGLLVSMTKK
jgi:SAM-dependent methyltransferase